LRKLELLFPLKDARATGCRLCLRDVAGVLQGDGERRVRKRIIGREHAQSHCRCDRLVRLACIAQCTDEAVMRLNVCRISGNGGAEGLRSLCGLCGGEQFHATVRKGIGIARVSHG